MRKERSGRKPYPCPGNKPIYADSLVRMATGGHGPRCPFCGSFVTGHHSSSFQYDFDFEDHWDDCQQFKLACAYSQMTGKNIWEFKVKT